METIEIKKLEYTSEGTKQFTVTKRLLNRLCIGLLSFDRAHMGFISRMEIGED